LFLFIWEDISWFAIFGGARAKGYIHQG